MKKKRKKIKPLILRNIEKFLKESGLTASELIRMLKSKPDEIIEIRPKKKCRQKQDELQKALKKIAKFY